MKHMTEIVLTVAAFATIAGMVAWHRVPDKVPAPAAGRSVHHAHAAVRERPAPSVVLSIDVSKPSSMAAVARAKAPVTLARELEQSTALRPLYDRLSAPGGAATPEAKYVLYRILSTCARRTDATRGTPQPPSRTERRKQLEASIPDANPLKAVRLKAFDDLDRCAGMEGVATTQAELDKLLDAAAQQGNAPARALQVQRDLGSDMPHGAAPAMETHFQALRDAVASKDPAAIAIAGTVLSNTFNDTVIEVGETHDALDNVASRQAWRLLACEYGLECGSGNQELQMACAFSGRCGPTTIPDLIYFYETTPNQAQLVEQYRQVFRPAIDANDWSGLTFASRSGARPESVFRFHTSGP
jgi:hypothetical protein